MNDRNKKKPLNLNLSLGLPDQEQDPVDEQDQLLPHEKQDLVDEQEQGQGQVSFMQLLNSYRQQNIQPSYQMTSFEDFTNGTNAWFVPAEALPPSLPPPSVSVADPYPYQPSGQFIHPPQAFLPAQGLPPLLQPPSVSATNNPCPYQPPPQANGTMVLDIPRRGRPPSGQGNQARSNPSRARGVDRNVGEREVIIPPYPWATEKPAVVQTFRDLSSKNINLISGQVHCKPCDITLTLEYNLEEKFLELYQYIRDNKEVLRQRAPPMWQNPELTLCGTCNSEMKPVIPADNTEEINWLFLLLGNMLGCCTLEQLRSFCELTSQHRTGAKDRVLYITYLGLCKQLDPDGPFDL